MRTCDPRSGGAHGVDGRYNAWRSGAPGPPGASRTRKRSEAGCGRPESGGAWAAKTVKRPPQQPAQPRHTNDGAPRTQKRHQQEHRPQRPTESSDPTQHAKGRTGGCPGPRKETATRRNVTQGGPNGLTTHCEPGRVSGSGGNGTLDFCAAGLVRFRNFHGARQSLTNHSPEHWVRTAARSKFPRFFGLCIRGSEHSASAHVSQSVRYNTRQ